jgi:hypothetical protein
MTITCCYGCKPPKRTPTCHATCPEYTQQKAQHDAELEQTNKAKMTHYNIRSQTGDGVRRANKRKKL